MSTSVSPDIGVLLIGLGVLALVGVVVVAVCIGYGVYKLFGVIWDEVRGWSRKRKRQNVMP